MRARMRQITAVVAMALVITFVGMLTVSSMGQLIIGRTNLLWLSILSAICGVLMALSNERALVLVLTASVLAVLIFGGLWSYIVWLLIGQYMSAAVSFFELALSDFVFLYVAQQGAVILIISAAFGMLGAVAVQFLLPIHYRL